jgi:hypothetical protein
LLIALFSFSLIGSAVFASPSGNLPECCRRDGKHHCAMMIAMANDQEDSPSGSAFKSVPEKCPFYPKAGALPSVSKTVVPQPSQKLIAAVVSYPAVIAQAESRYRVSFSRSRQKRGPPSVHS